MTRPSLQRFASLAANNARNINGEIFFGSRTKSRSYATRSPNSIRAVVSDAENARLLGEALRQSESAKDIARKTAGMPNIICEIDDNAGSFPRKTKGLVNLNPRQNTWLSFSGAGVRDFLPQLTEILTSDTAISRGVNQLSLAQCALGDESIEYLERLLKKNWYIKTLDLDHNNFDHEKMLEALGRAFKTNHSVRLVRGIMPDHKNFDIAKLIRLSYKFLELVKESHSLVNENFASMPSLFGKSYFQDPQFIEKLKQFLEEQDDRKKTDDARDFLTKLRVSLKKAYDVNQQLDESFELLSFIFITRFFRALDSGINDPDRQFILSENDIETIERMSVDHLRREICGRASDEIDKLISRYNKEAAKIRELKSTDKSWKPLLGEGKKTIDIPEDVIGVKGGKIIFLTTPEEMKRHGVEQNNCTASRTFECCFNATHVAKISIPTEDGKEEVNTIMILADYESSSGEAIYGFSISGYSNKLDPSPKANMALEWLVDAVRSGKFKVDVRDLKAGMMQRKKHPETLREFAIRYSGIDPFKGAKKPLEAARKVTGGILNDEEKSLNGEEVSEFLFCEEVELDPTLSISKVDMVVRPDHDLQFKIRRNIEELSKKSGIDIARSDIEIQPLDKSRSKFKIKIADGVKNRSWWPALIDEIFVLAKNDDAMAKILPHIKRVSKDDNLFLETSLNNLSKLLEWQNNKQKIRSEVPKNGVESPLFSPVMQNESAYTKK